MCLFYVYCEWVYYEWVYYGVLLCVCVYYCVYVCTTVCMCVLLCVWVYGCVQYRVLVALLWVVEGVVAVDPHRPQRLSQGIGKEAGGRRDKV